MRTTRTEIDSLVKKLIRLSVLLILVWAVVGDPPGWVIFIMIPVLLLAIIIEQKPVAEWLARLRRDQKR